MRRLGPVGEATQIALRVPPDLLEQIDAYADTMRATTPGTNPGRSDAVRALVIAGLATVARKTPIKVAKKTKK